MTEEAGGPEVALWRAVIAQAIEDATIRTLQDADLDGITEPRKKKSRQAAIVEATHLRDTARAWLLRNSADFRRVCYMAQLDPDAVRERAQALSRADWPTTKRAQGIKRRRIESEAA